jgi:hypothetical protein
METICAFNNTSSTKKREQQDLEQTVDKNDKKQKNECKILRVERISCSFSYFTLVVP